MTQSKKEPTDFFSKLIKPHKTISRKVREADLPRVIEDAKILYNLCYTQCGVHQGALAVAHSQITNKDPLRFFVTRYKEIIINPEIVKHTNALVDSKEGCVTFHEYKPTIVQRWNKCEVTYEIIVSDNKLELCQEKLEGRRSKMFQHEKNHFDAIYIYNID